MPGPADLRRLGFSKGSVSEVLLSLSTGHDFNIAPVGVRLSKSGDLAVKLYPGSRTYELVRRGARDYVINVTSDPVLFYYAVLSKNSLRLKPSRYVSAPKVAGCDAYVECVLSTIRHGREYLRLYLRPLHIEYRKTCPRPFCRAEPAIIEALIYLTKIPYLRRTGKLGEAQVLLTKIRYCVEVVEHSTRSRRLRYISRRILEKAENLMVK